MKKQTRKYGNTGYSDNEVQVIIEEIQNYPNNLKHAFEEASYRLSNRTPGAISAYYYKELKQGNTLIAMATPNGVIMNTKNSPRKQSGKVELLFRMLDMMSNEEKKAVALRIFEELK